MVRPSNMPSRAPISTQSGMFADRGRPGRVVAPAVGWIEGALLAIRSLVLRDAASLYLDRPLDGGTTPLKEFAQRRGASYRRGPNRPGGGGQPRRRGAPIRMSTHASTCNDVAPWPAGIGWGDGATSGPIRRRRGLSAAMPLRLQHAAHGHPRRDAALRRRPAPERPAGDAVQRARGHRARRRGDEPEAA